MRDVTFIKYSICKSNDDCYAIHVSNPHNYPMYWISSTLIDRFKHQQQCRMMVVSKDRNHTSSNNDVVLIYDSRVVTKTRVALRNMSSVKYKIFT